MPPSSVLITEEGPREGFQIEKGPISTARKVELIDALSETGLKRIQVASFVSLRQVPGMADADAIARQIRIKPGVEYTALWFNDAGLERARASGRLTLEGKVRIYPSDAFLKRNINRTPEQHLAHTHAEIARFKELGIPVRDASVSNAFGCNFQGDISLPPGSDGSAGVVGGVIARTESAVDLLRGVGFRSDRASVGTRELRS